MLRKWNEREEENEGGWTQFSGTERPDGIDQGEILMGKTYLCVATS